MDINHQIWEKFNEQAHSFPKHIDDDDERIKIVSRLLTPIDDKKIIDVGCGKGRFAFYLTKHKGIVEAVDPSEQLIKTARQEYPNINFAKAPAFQLPFPDNHFDAAICVEVIEHIPETLKSIKEMFRVLKPGADLIIIDKNKYGWDQSIPLPSSFTKFLNEKRNLWMYPRNFPFQEKWFSARHLKNTLTKNGGQNCKTYFFNTKKRPWHILPHMAYFIAWHAKKG